MLQLPKSQSLISPSLPTSRFSTFKSLLMRNTKKQKEARHTKHANNKKHTAGSSRDPNTALNRFSTANAQERVSAVSLIPSFNTSRNVRKGLRFVLTDPPYDGMKTQTRTHTSHTHHTHIHNSTSERMTRYNSSWKEHYKHKHGRSGGGFKASWTTNFPRK